MRQMILSSWAGLAVGRQEGQKTEYPLTHALHWENAGLKPILKPPAFHFFQVLGMYAETTSGNGGRKETRVVHSS